MAETLRNLFKASGLFKCRHPAHKRFGYEVSPYHIFETKKCFQTGCVEFLWRCHRLEKGHRCPRNFKHVGRNCFSCKEYHELKNCYSVETSLNDSSLRRFVDDLGEYRGWIEQMNGKIVRFSGIADSIKPHLLMTRESGRSRIQLDGYYISFSKGYLGNTLFDDRIYLSVGGGFLSRTGIAPGDDLELDAEFREKRGRVILKFPRRIDLVANSGRQYLTLSRALVARATGSVITGSAEYCGECQYCCMVDIDDLGLSRQSRYSRFFCLRGVAESENCPVKLGELLKAGENPIGDNTES